MVRDQHLAERAVPVARDEVELDHPQPLSGGRNCTPGKNFTGKSCHLREAVPLLFNKTRHSHRVAAMARLLLRLGRDEWNASMQISSPGSYFGLSSPSSAANSSPAGSAVAG